MGKNSTFSKFFNQSLEMEFYRQYWSGLGTGLLVVGSLIPDGVDVELIDENIEEVDFNREYDLVAITAMTQQVTRGYDIAQKFRRNNVKVVLGGIHPTVLPQEAQGYVDSVVVGEAENLWPQLWSDFKNDRLQPVYRSDTESDLSYSVIPRYELVKEKPYRMLWVQTSRGCPHDCSFCCASRVYGSKYRHKPVDQVVKEINEIRKIKKHVLIGFSDDNLFSDKDYSRELLGRLVDLRIKWFGQSDISVADDVGLVRLMKKSGCVALAIGFESINKDNLRGLDSANWKLKRLNCYPESIEVIQSNGIGIIGTFIVGFDNDDKSVFDELARFIIDNHLAGAQIAALTPFPGTRIRDKLVGESRVLDTPWENYTLYDVNIKPARMSPQELERGILDVTKKIYSPEVAMGTARYFKDVFHELRRSSDENRFNGA